MKQKIPKNAKIPFMKVIKKKWRLLVMLFPAMLFVFIFSYIPMAGIILAFKKYQVAGGVFFSPWNGLRNFKTLFLTNKMWIAKRNTFLYNLAFIFLGLIFRSKTNFDLSRGYGRHASICHDICKNFRIFFFPINLFFHK